MAEAGAEPEVLKNEELSDGGDFAPLWLRRLIGREDSPETDRGPSAISRILAPSASLSLLLASVHQARLLGNPSDESAACVAYAQALEDHVIDFASVISLSKRAISLGERGDFLSLASRWMTASGLLLDASQTLRLQAEATEESHASALLLARSARKLVHAGDTRGAMTQLLWACSRDPIHGECSEVAGLVAAASELSEAPGLLLEAARRFSAADESERSFGALRSAFELAPADSLVCAALVSFLDDIGRPAAADQILRVHAQASETEHAVEVHANRIRRLLDAGNAPSALAAFCDSRFEVPSLSVGSLVEDLLDKVGLNELLALRLEREAGRLTGEDASKCLVSLARLYMGRLANPERAVELWIEALQHNPACEDARIALRSHARMMGDQTPLIEALIRVGFSGANDDATASCLVELASVAEERLADPALASWATGRLVKLGRDLDSNKVALERLAPRVRLQESALRSARDASTHSEQPTVRLDALRRIASIFRGRPDEIDSYLTTLEQLVVLAPSERRWWIDLERASMRLDRRATYEKSLRDRIVLGASRAELLRLRSALVFSAFRSGDHNVAQQEAKSLLVDVPNSRLAHSALWLVGAALGDIAQQVQAMDQLAPSLATAVRAVVLAVACECHLKLQDNEGAQRLLHAAMRADATEPRVVDAQVAVAVRLGDADSVRALESAWSTLIPLGIHGEALLDAAELSKDSALAFTWAHRCFKLKAWDARVLARVASCAIRVGNTESLGLAVDAAFDALLPATDIVVIFDGVFRAFVALSPHESRGLVERILYSFGVGSPATRNLLLELAAQDPVLLAEVCEHCVIAVSASERQSFFLRAAEVQERRGHALGEASLLLRALATGGEASIWAPRLERLLSSSDGDVMIVCSHAQAILADAQQPRDVLACRDAWRRHASLLWDLAGDASAAIDAWIESVRRDDSGDSTGALVLDLELRALEAGAFAALSRAIDAQPEALVKARLWLVASVLAFRAGRNQDSVDCARRAILADTSRTEALLMIERAGDGAMAADAIDSAYTHAADASQGSAGRRAAHLRAARTLEQRGYAELAMPHAISAFEEKPIDGDGLSTMLRLANRVGSADVLMALERVADASADPTKRAAWLRRAASLASRSSDTLRNAFELVLRALSLDPTVEAAALLCDVVGRQLEFSPDDRDMVELRLQRASKGLVGRLEGPCGARVALLLARASVEALSAIRLAFTWTEIALDCSGDVDEYEALVAHADLFATDREHCSSFFATVLRRENSSTGTLGPALVRLCSSICTVLGDTENRSAFTQLAARLEFHEAEAGDPFAELASATSDEEPTMGPVFQANSSSPVESSVTEAPLGPSPMADSRRGPTLVSAAFDSSVSTDPLAEADSLAEQGELASAIRVLEDAASRGFDPDQTDKRLRALYESTGRNTQLCLVLGRLAERAQGQPERLQILIEIAGVLEARGDMDGASLRWNQVADLQPGHPDASAFLERDAVQRGDFERLVWLLHRRAQSSTSADDIRAIKMRLAAVLESHLSRSREAREELQGALAEHGESLLLLKALAELTERTQGASFAAALWARAAKAASKQSDVVTFACRAASSYLSDNRDAEARAILAIANDARSTDVLTILAALERRKGDHRALGDVLDRLATSSAQELSGRAHLLNDAAREALVVNDYSVALDRVERGLRALPNEPGLTLTRCLIEYRSAGLGDSARCSRTLNLLDSIVDSVELSDAPLHAFLSSEQIGAIRGAQGALDELLRRRSTIGSHPLLSLAVAERLAATGRHEESLPLFDEALQSPDLMGLRSREQIAFAAARAALLASGEKRAQPYIAIVDESPSAVEMAARLKREIEVIRAGVQAVSVASRQAISWRPPPPVAPPASAMDAPSSLAHSTRPMPSAQPALASAVLAPAPVPTLVSISEAQLVPDITPALNLAVAPGSVSFGPQTFAERTSFHPDGNRPGLGEGPKMLLEEEQRLFTKLTAGDIAAGDLLADSVSRDPSRTQELVGIRRRQVVISPADPRLLVALRDAALADHSVAHARAVDHVIGTLLGQPASKPPAIPTSSESPDRLLKMLFRGVHTDASQALADVWENAGRIFSKEPAAFGVTGLDRVAFGATTPVGLAYSLVAPALGLARTPLFQRRVHGPAGIAVVLMTQPSIIVSGDITYSDAELAYRLSCMLAATLTQNVLLFGLSRAQAKDLLGALVAAFGPPGGKVSESSTVLLAGELWRSLPARVQRRMHDLFAHSETISYDDLWARSLQSTRRVGLYVVADLGIALNSALEDPEVANSIDVNSSDRFLKLCQISPSAADLVRLATGADFAEVRWRDDGFERRNSQWNRPSGIPR